MKRIFLVFLLIFLVLSLLLSGCAMQSQTTTGKEDTPAPEPSPTELIQECINASRSVQSANVVTDMSFDDGGWYGPFENQQRYQLNGNDAHYQLIEDGGMTSESFIISGVEYYRNEDGEWGKGPQKTPFLPMPEWSSSLAETLGLSIEQEYCGAETLGSINTYHVSLALSSEAVIQKWRDLSAAQLASNTGAQFDIWIHADTLYPVKSEWRIHNVKYYEDAGLGELCFQNSFSGLGTTISIKPPPKKKAEIILQAI